MKKETKKKFIILDHGKNVASLIGKRFKYVGSSTYPQGIPFNIIGLGNTERYTLKVQTWEGRREINGKQRLCKKVICDYSDSVILQMIFDKKLI